MESGFLLIQSPNIAYVFLWLYNYEVWEIMKGSFILLKASGLLWYLNICMFSPQSRNLGHVTAFPPNITSICPDLDFPLSNRFCSILQVLLLLSLQGCGEPQPLLAPTVSL